MAVLPKERLLVDVIVVDEIDREPIGRPWLTLAVDVATRMVPGFHLTLEAPSRISMLREDMRGPDHQQNHLFSCVSPQQRVREDHPLPPLRTHGR